MSAFYRDWPAAHAAATEQACRLGLDVAIRTTTEYGKRGFVVHLTHRNDSELSGPVFASTRMAWRTER